MSRTRHVTWVYGCDATPCRGANQYGAADFIEVMRGDSCSTGRGTVVHDQADADAVARSAGWTIGTRVLCPTCAGGV